VTGGFSPTWLALREPADADARALDLVDEVRADVSGADPVVIADLGCGTGSMGRWLAGRLPGPQHWILYDHDAALLAHAEAGMPRRAGDGSAVTVETRRLDLAELAVGNLTGAHLVTASALLDLFTVDEVHNLAATCAGARCPALLTLSVLGKVELTPAEPLDADLAAAFNAHQRRTSGGRRLLGPDAVDAAAEAFTGLGAKVRVSPSPWRLGPDRSGLTASWLRGWVGAAGEQRPDLAEEAALYLQRRLDATAAGVLQVTVQHGDLYAKFE
jgi:hypothetical protein